MPLLVRAWNLFHGNAHPPQRRAFLREMVQLVTADEPDVVCLQEVPVWALRRLPGWSGMQAFGAVAARPRLGSAELGRWITQLDHGLYRSAFTGQANAILVAPRHRVPSSWWSLLSHDGEGERRICQGVRLEDIGVVANFHVTGGPTADPQFGRAVVAEAWADPDEPVVLCGDANLRPGEGTTYDLLRERGFSAPLPGSIDQILVRGRRASAPFAWPEERRRLDGVLLSDHAPIELTVE